MKKADKLTEVPKALTTIGKKVNELCDLAKPIKAGKGIKVVESKEDIMVSLSEVNEDNTGGGGADSDNHPFFPTPSTTDPEVTFEPGIIINAGQNISPTVDGGSTMATLPRPVMVITTTGTIYLVATVDAAGTATAIDTLNAATTPTDTATEKHLTIADVTLDGGLVTVDDRPVRESRNLFICGGTAIWD